MSVSSILGINVYPNLPFVADGPLPSTYAIIKSATLEGINDVGLTIEATHGITVNNIVALNAQGGTNININSATLSGTNVAGLTVQSTAGVTLNNLLTLHAQGGGPLDVDSDTLEGTSVSGLAIQSTSGVTVNDIVSLNGLAGAEIELESVTVPFTGVPLTQAGGNITLTSDSCGRTYMVDGTTGGFDITLPAVSHCATWRFINIADTPLGNINIKPSGALLYGFICFGVPAAPMIQQVNGVQVAFNIASQTGDRIEITLASATYASLAAWSSNTTSAGIVVS